MKFECFFNLNQLQRVNLFNYIKLGKIMSFFFIRNGLEWESVKPAQQSFNLPTLRQHEKCSNVQVSFTPIKDESSWSKHSKGQLGMPSAWILSISYCKFDSDLTSIHYTHCPSLIFLVVGNSAFMSEEVLMCSRKTLCYATHKMSKLGGWLLSLLR